MSSWRVPKKKTLREIQAENLGEISKENLVEI